MAEANAAIAIRLPPGSRSVPKDCAHAASTQAARGMSLRISTGIQPRDFSSALTLVSATTAVARWPFSVRAYALCPARRART